MSNADNKVSAPKLTEAQHRTLMSILKATDAAPPLCYAICPTKERRRKDVDSLCAAGLIRHFDSGLSFARGVSTVVITDAGRDALKASPRMRRLIDITLAATRQMGTPHKNWTSPARAAELLEELGINQAIVAAKRMLAALEAVEREEQQETGTRVRANG